mmetsp:Transcript_95313/g.221226  ORF Transcript_95313/g.221226 Transcript_95313/m.221226 type:complete len:90 (-) Transcript_95313:533-802(-)
MNASGQDSHAALVHDLRVKLWESLAEQPQADEPRLPASFSGRRTDLLLLLVLCAASPSPKVMPAAHKQMTNFSPRMRVLTAQLPPHCKG